MFSVWKQMASVETVTATWKQQDLSHKMWQQKSVGLLKWQQATKAWVDTPPLHLFLTTKIKAGVLAERKTNIPLAQLINIISWNIHQFQRRVSTSVCVHDCHFECSAKIQLPFIHLQTRGQISRDHPWSAIFPPSSSATPGRHWCSCELLNVS